MKLILFDLDGTLIDTSEGITKSAQYALDHYGISVEDPDDLRFFIGPPLTRTFMEHYGMDETEALAAQDKFRERYNPIGVKECKPFSGAKECLEALKDQGYLLSVASSKPEVKCKEILERFELDIYFDEIVGASYDGNRETKEQVLREAMGRFPQIKRDEMCLIGDTIYDVEGANQVGISSYAVSFGFGNVEEMQQAGALAVCHDLTQLPDLIWRL